jgi:hypothetical protein
MTVAGGGESGTTTAAVLSGTGFSTTVLSVRTVQAAVPKTQAATAKRAMCFIGFLLDVA